MIANIFSNMNFLSINIRNIRLLKGLSQEQFADDLGVSRSSICSYECNRSIPPINFIIKLSYYADISIDKLLKIDLNKLKF